MLSTESLLRQFFICKLNYLPNARWDMLALWFTIDISFTYVIQQLYWLTLVIVLCHGAIQHIHAQPFLQLTMAVYMSLHTFCKWRIGSSSLAVWMMSQSASNSWPAIAKKLINSSLQKALCPNFILSSDFQEDCTWLWWTTSVMNMSACLTSFGKGGICC